MVSVLEEDEVFRFGDGNTLRSKYRLQLQATFGGKMVLLAFSVVPVLVLHSCPTNHIHNLEFNLTQNIIPCLLGSCM